MVKIGIIGSTGYAGSELVRILKQHPKAEIKVLTSRSYIGKKFDEIYENFRDSCEIVCQEGDINKIAEEVDIIFIALPHGLASKSVTKEILSKVKVIDIGADFRLKSKTVYEKWYKTEHHNEELLKDAVYGLCEWNRDKIKKTNLVANPGCYTTCSILPLAPLVKDDLIDLNSIIIDAKSGVSGAGRALNLATHYTECNESIKAYKIGTHRHTPEIEQALGILAEKEIKLNFTPHLTPMNRGILATCYAKLKSDIDYDAVKKTYNNYYKDEFFIRLTKENVFPETKWVKGSNFCDIGFKIDERTNRIIVVSAIDNMVKGAAGQAVQNMNIMMGFEEDLGLKSLPIFPS